MFRAFSPRASPQVADQGDEDIYEAYESYAVSEEPSVSVCTSSEVGDGAVRRGSTFNDLDL